MEARRLRETLEPLLSKAHTLFQSAVCLCSPVLSCVYGRNLLWCVEQLLSDALCELCVYRSIFLQHTTDLAYVGIPTLKA